ncbi:MAG TPA: dihydroorotate dehydrogenase [Thermotogae bacterium]|nr:dihydroorotate dehydrogenase [Thermotogota bacterium]
MDLSVEICGLKFRNPLLPASGPLVGDAEKLLFLYEQGVGGLVTKTISTKAAEVPRPCIYATRDLVINAELWSEYPPEYWKKEVFPKIRDLDIPVIVSLGYTESDVDILVPMFDENADAFEFSTHYVGKSLDPIVAVVKTARKHTRKPIFMKLSPHMPDPVEFAKVVKEAGADGIVATNSLGPVYVADKKTGKSPLGSTGGYGWISGPVLKPISLAIVRRIAEEVDIPIIGVGGVAKAEDVLDYLESGASAVQMLSAALIFGKQLYGKIVSSLPQVLEKKGYSNVKDAIKRPIRSQATYQRNLPRVDMEKCTLCRLCEYVCPYFAITVAETVIVNEDACFGCGLCQSRCPVSAIEGVF